jgi:hypothetical protein
MKGWEVGEVNISFGIADKRPSGFGILMSKESMSAGKSVESV